MRAKSHRVKMVEKELDLELHPQYAKFLNRYGSYFSTGVEVYGYSEDFTGIDGYPCVIFTTKDSRKDFHLNPTDILIAETEDSDFVAVLDNETGEVFETDINGIRTVVAASFDEWFAMVRQRDYV